MKEFKIGNNEEGQRLDKLLNKILNEATKGFIYKMLRKKNITLNNKKASGNEILKSDDVVKIFLSDETFDKFSKVNVDSNIVGISKANKGIDKINKTNKSNINNKESNNNYNNKSSNYDLKKYIIAETKDYMIINKPAGMLSQKAEKDDISLVELIIDYMLKSGEISTEQLRTFKPSICNRLDRNTSGLLIAGKSLIGLQKMTEYIKNRDIDKYYLAFVKGKVDKGGKIEGYLVKDSKTNKVKVVAESSFDYINTEYEVLASNNEYSLLKVKLITGKTHQIRAHLASINHPIIGDYKYGDRKINDEFKKKYGLEYQMLHSYEVNFNNKDKDELGVKGKKYKALPDNRFIRIVEEKSAYIF